MEDLKISGSIVIYNEDKSILKKSIESFLGLQYKKELIIVDNSITNYLEDFCKLYDNVKYIFLNKNVGFAKSHNIAFSNLSLESDIHLVMNPDIYFNSWEISDFIKWFFNYDSVLAIPNVLYPSGQIQYVCRNIPTLKSLIKRKFIEDYDIIQVPKNSIKEIPFAHGCFFAIKSDIYKKLNGFDERFFMYMEDVDFWLRAKQYGRTVINTNYNIFHYFRKGSSKSFKLFLIHLISIYKFYKKYKFNNVI